MTIKMKRSRIGSRWISKSKFKELEVGDELLLRFMIGKNEVSSKPYLKDLQDLEGNFIKNDCVKVKFYSGPWKGKELELVRQQIKAKKHDRN